MSNKGVFWGRTTAQKLTDESEQLTESGCLIWTGALNNKGYGVVRSNGKNMYAHRAAWELKRGAIPLGLCVLHRCDVPSCINVNHLFLGSIADNNADMRAKGRECKAVGESAGNAKLTEAQVLKIRSARGTEREIARAYGLGHTTVGSIRRRKTWTHVV